MATAAEELGHLLLQRLLQDQPRSQPADQLHRILLCADASQRVTELGAKPLARGYSRDTGVTRAAAEYAQRRGRNHTDLPFLADSPFPVERSINAGRKPVAQT